MLKRDRHIYILEKVEKEGRLLTKDLVADLNIAEDTVRKDFQELSAKGKVQRFHGGVLRIANEPRAFAERVGEQASVKQRLAKKAVEYVLDQHVLYIDGGTTNLRFAQNLPLDFKGTVITNDPAIALALCDHPNIELSLIGGILNKTTKVITGMKAIEQVQEVNVECCILGVSSLSEENGITYPISDEAVLKQEVLAHSKQVIAIASKDKIGSTSTFYAANLKEIDILITDEEDLEIIQSFEALGIKIVSEKIEL